MSDAKQITFLVWRSGEDPDDGAANCIAEDVSAAARQTAFHDHAHRHGDQWTWPVEYIVQNITNGRKWTVRVERTMIPEFWAGKPKPMELR